MKKLAYKRKSKFILVLMPMSEQIETKNWSRWQKKCSQLNSYYIESPNKKFQKWLEGKEGENINYVDLLLPFRRHINTGKHLYFPIDGHLNEYGHLATANILSKKISAEMEPNIKTQ